MLVISRFCFRLFLQNVQKSAVIASFLNPLKETWCLLYETFRTLSNQKKSPKKLLNFSVLCSLIFSFKTGFVVCYFTNATKCFRTCLQRLRRVQLPDSLHLGCRYACVRFSRFFVSEFYIKHQKNKEKNTIWISHQYYNRSGNTFACELMHIFDGKTRKVSHSHQSIQFSPSEWQR